MAGWGLDLTYSPVQPPVCLPRHPSEGDLEMTEDRDLDPPSLGGFRATPNQMTDGAAPPVGSSVNSVFPAPPPRVLGRLNQLCSNPDKERVTPCVCVCHLASHSQPGLITLHGKAATLMAWQDLGGVRVWFPSRGAGYRNGFLQDCQDLTPGFPQSLRAVGRILCPGSRVACGVFLL